MIRKIKPCDNARVAEIIRTVMPEFGAVGPGFAINDPEVDQMAETYCDIKNQYFVIEVEGQILGAGGFGTLKGADATTCEVRKMYFLKSIRGKGWGRKLLNYILEEAKKAGFKTVYLETLQNMTDAQKLYQANAFTRLQAPMGATGHSGCDVWYARSL